MAKMMNGQVVLREGKCMDCGERIAVLASSGRTACNCQPKQLTPEQRAQKEWMEKTFNPKKSGK